MTIEVKPLHTIDELRSIVVLQQQLGGTTTHSTWQLPHLLDVRQSGGLLLGIHEGESSAMHPTLVGYLVDLIAEMDDYPARRTISWGVAHSHRNRRLGMALRLSERRCLQRERADLVYWDVDPLNSVELHHALNKLGGIATQYRANALGSSHDPRAPGMATDRLRIEWWLDAPRVIACIDKEQGLPHQRLGLHEMAVITKTTVLPSGVRGLVHIMSETPSNHLLVEIPETLGHIQAVDHEAAIQWRLQTRQLMQDLLIEGYLGIGNIHQGERSFLLFKKGTRRSELSATPDN